MYVCGGVISSWLMSPHGRQVARLALHAHALTRIPTNRVSSTLLLCLGSRRIAGSGVLDLMRNRDSFPALMTPGPGLQLATGDEGWVGRRVFLPCLDHCMEPSGRASSPISYP